MKRGCLWMIGLEEIIDTVDLKNVDKSSNWLQK
jgi:hypothetical protein